MPYEERSREDHALGFDCVRKTQPEIIVFAADAAARLM